MYIWTRDGFGESDAAAARPSFNPPAVTIPRPSTFARVEYEIGQILADPEAAKRWQEAGKLQPRDLFITHPSRSANRFRPASAFDGSNKCNVFDLDVAWRSGFRVPLLNIGTKASSRYSYPLANSLATFAARALCAGEPVLLGSDGTQWGWVATTAPATQINSNIARGDESPAGGRMYIVVGFRRTGTGHAGIIKHITQKTNDTGRIRDITYEGWEATSDKGVQAFTSRSWSIAECGDLTRDCRKSNPSGTALSAFCAIHIIGLAPESAEGRRGVLTGGTNKCRLL